MRSIEEKYAQFRKPTGILGKDIVEQMNRHHNKLTTWGLSHINISTNATILDIGCGGGMTLYFFAKNYPKCKTYGIDYSEISIEASKKLNEKYIQKGIVKVQFASVSSLPFPDNMFDVVTGIETSYFWPDFSNNLKEILRVLKLNGILCLINEVYKVDKENNLVNLDEERKNEIEEWIKIEKITLYTPKEYQKFLKDVGYIDIETFEAKNKGWIVIKGKKQYLNKLISSK